MTLKALIEKNALSSFISDNLCSHDGKPQEIINVCTKEKWKTIIAASKEQVQQAILEAKKTHSLWKNIPAKARAKCLAKIAKILVLNKPLFAEIMAKEIGKPIREGQAEVDYAASFFQWFAGEAERVYGLEIPASYSNKLLQIRYQPIGVCGLITPWNFPIAMIARKLAPALASGCTAVVKPSPECPMSALMVAFSCKEAGVPPGAVSILLGDEAMIGKALLSSSDIRKISFTGSTDVGRFLYRESAKTMKKLTLELGGNAPFIVFEDADIKKALKSALIAKFRNSSQTCIAANRFFIHEKVYDQFIDQFQLLIKKLKVGNPLDIETDISSHLHPLSEKKVLLHIQDAVKKGASLILKGEKPSYPTMAENVTDEMLFFHEETFGPFVPIMRFTNDDEAIWLANKTNLGLASYIFTQDLSKAYSVSNQLEYGIVCINDGLPSCSQASFGGIKDSGLGREGGPSGIYEYLEQKYLSISL